METTEKRSVTRTSELVDQAILLYDAGAEDIAMKMLLDINFSEEGINRVLREPSKRRKFINSLVVPSF